MTVGEAKAQIVTDGFTVGDIFPSGAQDDWFVSDQAPAPDSQRPPGTAINFTASDTKPGSCPP
jgi:hypothetical protein